MFKGSVWPIVAIATWMKSKCKVFDFWRNTGFSWVSWSVEALSTNLVPKRHSLWRVAFSNPSVSEFSKMFRPIPILQDSPSDADIKRFSINPAIWNMGLGRFGSLVGSISFQPTWCSFPKRPCNMNGLFTSKRSSQNSLNSSNIVISPISLWLKLSRPASFDIFFHFPNPRYPTKGTQLMEIFIPFHTYDILWFTNSLRPWKKQTYPAICLSKAHGVDKHILWAQQIRRSMAQPSDGHTFVPGCFPKLVSKQRGGVVQEPCFWYRTTNCPENFVSQYQVQWMDSNMVSFPNNEMISRSKIWNIRMYS